MLMMDISTWMHVGFVGKGGGGGESCPGVTSYSSSDYSRENVIKVKGSKIFRGLFQPCSGAGHEWGLVWCGVGAGVCACMCVWVWVCVCVCVCVCVLCFCFCVGICELR
jgi:hypothetical protein